MDSRLTRGMNPEAAQVWRGWFHQTQGNLDELRRVLTQEIAASHNADDSHEAFRHPAALAGLAHSAGYREGLRAAIALMTPKKA